MQRVNEFNFYELAVHVHRLTELDGDVYYNTVFYDWFQARDILNKMFTRRPLSVTLTVATELYNALSEFVPLEWEKAVAKVTPKREDLVIHGWQLYQIKEAADKFETILAAECQVLDTYFVDKKGAYSTVDLVERAHIVFGPLMPQIPDQAKNDFDQAGKSLAFDLPTSSAFHSLRGTETVLRRYYEVVIGKPPKAKMRNWFAYIKHLKDHKADARITSFLDHIRETYRNPVLHPEETVDADQALILFGACVSVVSLMVRETGRLTAKSAKPLQFPVGAQQQIGRESAS